jgi:hypothetical protein
VTLNPEASITKYIYDNRFREHCKVKEGLPTSAFDLIDWDSIHDARTMAPDLFNIWMTKQVSGHCGVGKMMKRWKFWDDSKCHSCDEPNEDTCHILYCLHKDCHRAWDEAVVGLDKWMTSIDTDPLIQYCIVSTLSPRDPNTIFHAYTDSPCTYVVAAEQDNIGWSHFIKGRVSRCWQLLQDEYYQSIASKRISRSWTEGLVSNILSLVHKQWIACNAVVHARNERGLKE